MTVAQTSPHTTTRSWGEIIPPQTCVRIAVVAVLLGAVYWATIWNHLIGRWANDGNWSHGWLVPVFSGYLLATQRERLAAVVPRANYFGAVVLVCSLGMYFAASWWWPMIYPQIVSIVGSILGLTLLLGGWRLIRIAWFPILFLMFAMPLPQSLYVELTLPLRALASTLAAAIMPLFASGLYCEAQSVVIDYQYFDQRQTLNVAEACSGMRLLMAFMTLGVAMAYLGNRALWQRVIMVLCCIPIALMCNTIRVTITGLLFVYGRKDLAEGTPHQLLGVSMLVIAFGLYALVGFVLNQLFVEDTGEDAIAGPRAEGV